ncbi:anthocyanidin 3-O-glucosyltransferase 2 [Brachypodium distachyon]|uniref:Glycosyltransferase n=1 Tax=Brachypodium distachyon TaxID=15368 RepID=I1GTF8_BRADI|nr:anthocyanidin 3-O-glucosyltransferase 2 [Brachypodium distachyon]KQK15744.1 hypothetical protein BRADI_1g24667v3 [Brachypodium distachyon]|eukprot:XP_010236959.1 anthocyanidin 3-O-glucosyltransferase 2 [Brachypodium distachyon]
MSRPTVVLVPCWGSGHFMSALEAGKRLLDSGGGAFSLTVLLMHSPTQIKASEVEGHVRREAASGLDIRFLQLPAVEHPTGCVDPVEFESRYAQLHAPHVKSAIAGLQRVAAVVVDFFLTTLFDAAHELAVPAYVYFPSPAAFLALMLSLPELREDLTRAGFVEETEATVDVPGLPPVPARYTPACLVRAVQSYDWFEYHGRRFMEARGVIVNTSAELEASVLAALPAAAPPVHAIGPVIWFSESEEDKQRPPAHECVRWLDAQPAASVVFICFGSMGFLDAAQVREVAVGLQRSGHRFLWVLRGPPHAGSRFPTDAEQLEELLPEGFMAATAGKGMVWPAWAPQKEILSHAAVGGFVTHCGWNSVLESLWFGVPMLPWPLYGEQHLNAFELVAGVGVAVVALGADRKEKKGSFVEAVELERAVRSLMGGGSSEEGTKAREKAAEMRAACRKAVDEGGSSRAALQRLVREILESPANPMDGTTEY